MRGRERDLPAIPGCDRSVFAPDMRLGVAWKRTTGAPPKPLPQPLPKPLPKLLQGAVNCKCGDLTGR